jgi:hypothetical protein
MKDLLPPPLPSNVENRLFLAVLPLVHYSKFFAGETYEEVMTLLPDLNFATEFRLDQVDQYIETFKNAVNPKYTGQQPRSFQFNKYSTDLTRPVCVVVVTIDG